MQPHCNISINHITSLILNFPVVGFSGSRNPYSQASKSISNFLPQLASLPAGKAVYSGIIGVGCANGVDQHVRSYFAQAKVFKVQPPINRKAFALRSARLVSWVASSSGILVAFPSISCPPYVTPSLIFHGYSSGRWGSIALAIGMGAPVLVYIHSSLGNIFPAPQSLVSHFTQLGFSFGGYWWQAG